MPKRDVDDVRLLNLGPTAAWRTQAVYHATAELMTADTPDTIILCQPLTPYLCLGYHQDCDSVLDREECERRALQVVRRRVGGGLTYLDANQLFYQCVFHHARLPVKFEDVYARMLAAPVKTLHRLGLSADLVEVNEIEVQGLRIAGVGGGRIGEACVVVGNILFDFDYAAMTAVWNAPWASFRELASAALRERITTLWRHAGPVTIEAVQWILLEEFEKALGRKIVRGKPTREETRRARVLAKLIGSERFLQRHSDNGVGRAMRSLKISAGVFICAAETEINAERVRASFRVDDGLIAAARLDSESRRGWEKQERELVGMEIEQWRSLLRVPARATV